ncbi:MAG: Lon protease family protein [Pseudomonadota bacterium]
MVETVQPLDVARVYRHCPVDRLEFETTDDLEPLDLLSAHQRAADSLRFGTDIRSPGYNLFVLGEGGAGKHQMVSRFLQGRAEYARSPSDWVYVYHFDEPARPRCLELPAGVGRRFREDMTGLIDDLRTAIPALFESEEYQGRLQELEQTARQEQQAGIEEVREAAEKQDIVLLTTSSGFSFAPSKDGEIMEPETFNQLPEEERRRIEQVVEKLQEQLQQALQKMPRLMKSFRQQVTALNEEMLVAAIDGPLGELTRAHEHHDGIRRHLEAVRKHIVEHVNVFQEEQPEIPPEVIFRRCQVNLLVDNSAAEGAPVIYQDLPTHQHLVGRIEHHVRDGALLTDFSLIRPGALHRANGGYLLLDARSVLMQPGAWDTLKRNLRAGEIRTESLEQAYGLISTVSLEPEPVPLDVKIVLMGDRMLYYLLSAYDPDFADLFKVQVDLEDSLQRSEDNLLLFARMIATLAREAGTRPLDPPGVATVIEQASRQAQDQERLDASTRQMGDLLREAEYWAATDNAPVISRSHVERAVREQIYRAERYREQSLEQIRRGTVMIATTGTAVAQINGLSVLQLGHFAFGRPTRISATARPGRGQVVDIEREAKMGGPIHSKAVMILTRFLASHYAPDSELSLSASLAFEQSYGGIEGDSASVAEVCVLISAIGRVPLRQDLAVTGSINQHGDVQAVGGVNEKIEGFFRACRAAGTLAGHGVLLPASNVEHLMLPSRIREAVEDGSFRIYPVATVDEALTLLTGREVGKPDDEGRFPEGSVHEQVAARLQRFRQTVRAGHREASPESDDDPS